MAKLTLETAEVIPNLKPILEQHLSDVQIRIDGDKAFISGKKAFLAVEVRFVCNVDAPSNRITFNLFCSMAARYGLESMGDAIRKGRPYIESLDSTQCVINLDKVAVGGKVLTDFMALNSLHVPGPNGLFAAADFSMKPQ